MNLIIEKEAVSQNDRIFGTNQGASRHLYKKFRDNLQDRLTAIVGQSQKEENRTAWLFERHWGKRKSAFDHANLIGGFKPLIDSMIKVGIVKDDSPDLFKAYYTQQKSTSGIGFIKIYKLNPREEVRTAFGEMAESFEIEEDILLQIANDVGLIKQKEEK